MTFTARQHLCPRDVPGLTFAKNGRGHRYVHSYWLHGVPISNEDAHCLMRYGRLAPLAVRVLEEGELR